MTILFEALRGAPCGYLNCNDLAKSTRNSDPALVGEKIGQYHQQAGIEWSYGGYHEVRDVLWANVPYLKKNETFLHLGVDFNVPAGTPVMATRPGVVVSVDDDHEEYGWGPRVIMRLKCKPAVYLIYAHLERVTCRAGQVFQPNKIIAYVGRPPHNGGWFPHLHVQALTETTWQFYKPRLSELDGYGKAEDAAAWARKCPDPLPYLKVW